MKPLIADTQPRVADAHSLFNLKGAGENNIPLSKYFTCDINIGGYDHPRSRDFGQNRQTTNHLQRYKNKTSDNRGM